VVGLNSDASVRRLNKASDRPLMPESARARLLAALEAVDCVVLFDEPTPLELIVALAPDVLVKGADYIREQIVGADEVERLGGRVVRVQLVDGYSTTRIVERLRGSI
jgi:rfaE bifunctional protein nucleotidyltransferase chain/domain